MPKGRRILRRFAIDVRSTTLPIPTKIYRFISTTPALIRWIDLDISSLNPRRYNPPQYVEDGALEQRSEVSIDRSDKLAVSPTTSTRISTMGDETKIVPVRVYHNRDRFSLGVDDLIDDVGCARNNFPGALAVVCLNITNSNTIVELRTKGDIRWKRRLNYESDEIEPPPSSWVVTNLIEKLFAIPHETCRLMLQCSTQPIFTDDQAHQIVSSMNKNQYVKTIHILTTNEGLFTPNAWQIILGGIGKMKTVKTLSIYGKPLIGQFTTALIDPDMAAIMHPNHPLMKRRPGCFTADTGNEVVRTVLERAVIPNKSITSLCFRNIGADDDAVDFILANVIHRLNSIRLSVNNITDASLGKLLRAIRMNEALTSCLLTYNPLITEALWDEISKACLSNCFMQQHMETLFEKGEISRILSPGLFFSHVLRPVCLQPTHVFNVLRNVDLVRMQIGPPHLPYKDNNSNKREKEKRKQENTEVRRLGRVSNQVDLPWKRRLRPRLK